jgi:cell division protein FtsQ
MWDDPLWLRRIANFLFGMCVLSVLVTAGHYLVQRPEFALQRIEVTKPLRHVSKEQLARLIHEQIQGNFFTVNLVRTRLALEQVPWVRKVSVRRKFPWALAVDIEEHQVLARWNETELVNIYGEVFSGQYEPSLPHFIGQPGTSEQVTRLYGELTQVMLPMKQPLTQISLSPRFSWQVRLANGIVLELGHEQMQQRLARFVAVYPYSLAKLSIHTKQVDLRYRNGFAAYLGQEIEVQEESDSDNSV